MRFSMLNTARQADDNFGARPDGHKRLVAVCRRSDQKEDSHTKINASRTASS